MKNEELILTGKICSAGCGYEFVVPRGEPRLCGTCRDFLCAHKDETDRIRDAEVEREAVRAMRSRKLEAARKPGLGAKDILPIMVLLGFALLIVWGVLTGNVYAWSIVLFGLFFYLLSNH